MNSMEEIIKSEYSKKLDMGRTHVKIAEDKCNCRRTENCPLNGNCQVEGVVCRATI